MKKLFWVFLSMICFGQKTFAQRLMYPLVSDTAKVRSVPKILGLVVLTDTGHQKQTAFFSFQLLEKALGCNMVAWPKKIPKKDTKNQLAGKVNPATPLSEAKPTAITPLKVPGLPGSAAMPVPASLNTQLLASQQKLGIPVSAPAALNRFNLPGSSSATPANQTLASLTNGNLTSNPMVTGTTALPNTVLTSTVNSEKNLFDQNIMNNPLPANALSGLKSTVGDPLTSGKLGATQFLSLSNTLNQNFKAAKTPSLTAGVSIENDLQYQPIPAIGNNISEFQNVVTVSGQLKLFGVPLSLNVSNNHAAVNGQNPLGNSLFKVGFTPQSLSAMMQSQLQQYANLKNTAFHGFDFTDYVHQTITEQVNTLDKSEGALQNSALSSYLKDPDKLQGLIQMSDAQLKQKLEAVAAQKPATTTGKTDSASMAQANKLKADSVANVITGIKTEMTKQGLDPNKLILDENYLSGRTSQGFNSTESASALNDKNSSGALQSFFSNVTDLKIGTFGGQIPGSTDGQGKLLGGGSLSIKADDYPLTFGFGKVDDINSLKDANYSSSVYSYTQDVTYIGAQLHQSAFGNVKVSLVSSFSSQANNFQYSDPVLPGNSVAFNISKDVNMGDWGKLGLNVSKSSTLFDDNYEPGSQAILEKKAGGDVNLEDNLFESLSVGFDHSLDIRQLDAHENVYFSYSGLGYQNPANNGYTGNTIKAGGDLKKKLLKNKLSLDFRTDYDITPMSYTADDKWKNYQMELDSRYQVTNHFNLSFKYTATGTDRDESGISSSVYGSQKLELDANDTYKIGRYTTTSALTVGNQILSDSYVTQSQSSLLNVNYIQSILFKTSSLTGTVFYNKELSDYQLIGNMLTSDVSYQYKLFKKFQLSSGLTYLDNEAIAKQIGVKQSLQLIAAKQYDVSASVNLNKNLITPEYADLYSQCRAELTFKYHFKVD